MYLETRKEKQLKFTNPIRDYKHLMVNRIIHSMIDLRELIDKTDYKKLPEEEKDEEPIDEANQEEAKEEEQGKTTKKKGKKAKAKKVQPKKKKQKKDHPLRRCIQAHEDLLAKLKSAIKEQNTLIKLFHRYESDKEGIKEGYGDINMRRAERQITQVEYAFKLLQEQSLHKFLVVSAG